MRSLAGGGHGGHAESAHGQEHEERDARPGGGHGAPHHVLREGEAAFSLRPLLHGKGPAQAVSLFRAHTAGFV